MLKIKQLKNFILIVLFLSIISCSSKKEVVYLQDLDEKTNLDTKFSIYKIAVDDILKIDVNAENPETTMQFNPKGSGLNMNSLESMTFNGYQVASNGTINFPSVGNLLAKGKTIEELRKEIISKIVTKGLLIDPIVDIKILNQNFTILGEVVRPGNYKYLKNNLSVLEAIGMAGDLTINGKRKDIKIIRNYPDDNRKIISIDLRNSDFIKNNNFQIFSGDIIIINPNTTRIKNAGIIGNSGTLLSLLSFILSTIIVTTR